MAVDARFRKQPGDRLFYDVDFSVWLGDQELIESVAVSQPGPSLLTIDSTTVASTGRVAKILVSGGQDGTRYQLTVAIVTNLDQRKEVEIEIQVAER